MLPILIFENKTVKSLFRESKFCSRMKWPSCSVLCLYVVGKQAYHSRAEDLGQLLGREQVSQKEGALLSNQQEDLKFEQRSRPCREPRAVQQKHPQEAALCAHEGDRHTEHRRFRVPVIQTVRAVDTKPSPFPGKAHGQRGSVRAAADAFPAPPGPFAHSHPPGPVPDRRSAS